MDEDSDEEFLGFNTDDLENDEGTADFKEVAWKYGRAQLTISRHKKSTWRSQKMQKSLNSLNSKLSMSLLTILLFKKLINMHRIFFNSPKAQNLKPQSKFW